MKTISESAQRKAGICISYLSLACSLILYILYTPFLLKHIGDIQYGLKSFVDSITSWMTVLSSAMASSYIRFATIEKKKNADNGLSTVNGVYFGLFSLAALLSVCVSIIVFVLFSSGTIPLNNYSSEQKDLILALLVISSSIVILSIFSSLFSLFEEFNQKYIWLRTVSLLTTVLHAVVAIPFLLHGCNVIAVVLCTLGVNVFFLLLNLVYCFKHLKFRFLFLRDTSTKSLIRSIIVFSFYILLNTLVDEINNNADKIILGFLSTPQMVTRYQLGMTFSTYMAVASVAVSSSFIPRVNYLVANKRYEEVNKTFLKVSKIQMIVVFTIIGGFASCGKDFVFAWVGTDKIDAFYVGLTLLFLDSVPLTENIGIEVQRAMNKHKFRAFAYIIIALINVIISVILVYCLPKDKAILGCLIGTVFAAISGTWISMNIYNEKAIHLPIKQYFREYSKYLIITVFSVSSCYLVFNGGSLFFTNNFWIKAILEGLLFMFFEGFGFFAFDRNFIVDILHPNKG